MLRIQSEQALIVLWHPETYAYKTWHGTLIVIAIVLIACFFNTALGPRLPIVQSLVFAVHTFGFLAIFITLWVLSPKKPAHAVFTEFTNNGGWSSMGLSFMVGLLPLAGSLSGIDCVAHMGKTRRTFSTTILHGADVFAAEEVQDSSRALPIALMTSLPMNAGIGFLTVITLCFCTYDVEGILSSPVGAIGYPFIQIFQNATGNLAATTILVILPLISLTGSVIAEVATASRQLWSFARDGGVPFSTFISRVCTDSNADMSHVDATSRLTVAGLYRRTPLP